MGISVFFSYSHSDSDMLHIPEIERGLGGFLEIDEVMFSQRDVQDNFVTYMNQALAKCKVVVLFCTQTSSNSRYVESEWTAAEANNLPIIPVFIDPQFIPPYLRSRDGVQIDPANIFKSTQEIHQKIMKKCGEGGDLLMAMPSTTHTPVSPQPVPISIPTAKMSEEGIIPAVCPQCGAPQKKAGKKGPTTCKFCQARIGN